MTEPESQGDGDVLQCILDDPALGPRSGPVLRTNADMMEVETTLQLYRQPQLAAGMVTNVGAAATMVFADELQGVGCGAAAQA
eukprot:1289637-Prymnesium_polylepis.1